MLDELFDGGIGSSKFENVTEGLFKLPTSFVILLLERTGFSILEPSLDLSEASIGWILERMTSVSTSEAMDDLCWGVLTFCRVLEESDSSSESI